MRVLVVTCSAAGDDARIVHRQIRSLRDAGHEVILVSERPSDLSGDPEGLVRVAIPRARGRRRWRSWCAARAAVARHLASADLLLIHDPELVPVLLLRRSPVPTVWDVREDYVSSVSDRRWVPAPARRVMRDLVRGIYWLGVRRCRLILAEDSYAEFIADAPVVPNSTWVPTQPAPLRPRADGLVEVVYVGRLSVARGAREMIELGRELVGDVRVVLIGEADEDTEALLATAAADGVVDWAGPLPNPLALARVDGALFGLSLLHPEPNYVHSRPTKILEYFAHGVPVITTPLPLAVEVVEASGAGVVVDHGDVAAAAATIRSLASDPDRRRQWGRAGHEWVVTHFNWHVDGQRFVALLEQWAQR